MSNETEALKSKALTTSRVIVNIVWYLSIFTVILVVVLAVVMLATDFKVAFIQLPLEVQFESVAGAPAVQIYGEGSPPIWGFSNLRVHAHEIPGLGYALLMPLILILGIVWIIHHLRELLRALSQAGPFAPENPGRIRKIGWALVVAGPVFGLFTFLYGFIYGKYLDIPGARVEAPFDMHAFVIFVGLIVLVIAQIFEVGVRLQREQNLTV